MKALLTITFLLTGFLSLAQNLSNKGKEFWTGYGHNQFFTTNQGNGEKMVLYLSAEEPATVTVSINGTSWVKTYNIPANTVIPTDLIPKTGEDDARIKEEGLNNHAIHIVSDTPIVAYAHIYGETSSGATMLLPVETYGYNYFSMNTEQEFDKDCFSWFFVVASENNTRIRITPTQPTVGGILKNQSIEVDLQKGQIYNIMGKIRASTYGYDITGSKAQSIEGADGKCHPIAAFSGSSRTRVCTTFPFSGGGDYIIQQVFPASAWSNEYLTAPTTSTLSASVSNNNKFRIMVQDRTTIVKRNGIRITGLVNNFYYEFLSGEADLITADKPIMVAQIMPSGGGCGTQGGGDPELFYLSSLSQATKKVSFFNTDKEGIAANYVTIIIPTGGITSLNIDGSNRVNYSYPHPNKPGYTVAIKRLATADAQHTVQSDSAFTAITYGMGFAESYGYNAGTLINNLDTKLEIKNEYATANTAYTCPTTSFMPVLKTMYRPSTILWEMSKVPGIQPATDTVTNLQPADSVYENGRLYFIYPLGSNYTFSDTGIYTIPITITDPVAIENCSKTQALLLSVLVKAGPEANFNYATSTCLTDSIQFSGISPNPTEFEKWIWDFGDNTTDSIANPVKKYALAGNYTTKMTVVRSVDGCTADTSKNITVYGLPQASFEPQVTICLPNGNASFTNQSTIADSNQLPLQYEWQFGDGKTSSITEPTHNYSSAGVFTVLLKAISAKGCIDTVSKTIKVNPAPKASFNISSGSICQNNEIRFTNASNANGASIITWQWNFGDGQISADTNTAHVYTTDGKFDAKLVIYSAEGCSDSTIKTITVYKNPVADFSTSTQAICQGKNVAFTSTSTNVTKWDWSFGDGGFSTNSQPNHQYNNSGNFTAKLKVATTEGCVDSTTAAIAVNENPTAAFLISDTAVCQNADITFSSSSLPTSAGIATWNWNMGDGDTITGSSLTHQYENAGTFTVKLHITTTTGCTDSTTRLITIAQGPQVSLENSADAICPGETITFTGKGIPDNTGITGWAWNFGDGSTATGINPSKNYTRAGIFNITLTATNDGGCASPTIEKQITVNPAPRVDAGPDVVTNLGTPVTLQASTNGDLSTIKWTPAVYLSATNILKPVATVSADQWYYLTVSGLGNCTATDSVRISIQQPLQYIPNAFSPNGDGINDTWGIPYMEQYPAMRLTIFDRWGSQVFNSSQQAIRWNGKNKGKEAPIGVYYFIANDGDKKLSGSITLLR